MSGSEPLSAAVLAADEHPAGTTRAWLRWRLNRLRCMSPAEVAHRVLRLLGLQMERLLFRIAWVVPAPDLTRSSLPWIHVPEGIAPTAYLNAADRIVAGRFDVFALHDIELGSPPHWNRDPRSGINAPLTFGKLLDYRDPHQVGDIKYLWEPNRHLHLVTLAQAYALSGDRKYLATIVSHLESWFAACPAGLGANWSSSLEAGIRLINWSATWQLLGGVHSPLFQEPELAGFRERWLQSVFQHAEFIQGHFSLYSSANNHLIGEASGLFIAALTWTHWPQARQWQHRSQKLLEREAHLQNAEDGVNREQAVAYQQFEFDLLLLPLLAAKANGLEFSEHYCLILERMLEFIVSIMDVGGNVPMFGDADDGAALRPDPGKAFSPFHSALATGAILFQREAFARKAGRLDDKTCWLLGQQARLPFVSSSPASLPVRHAFPEGGYYILGAAFETPREIRLVVDAGPLGYQRIAAHGHADALSFTLSLGGREFLIDPGTYAYHTQGAWRQYFRGTSAHNTLRVDGQDQSLQGGNFMWLEKATAWRSDWRSSASEDVFEGVHDGYCRLADPVKHQRRISLDKSARRILIEDRLQMLGTHQIELFFHCSEHCRVEPMGESFAMLHGPQAMTIKLPPDNRARQALVKGQTTPPLGWVSRHFDEKTPTTTLVWSGQLSGTTVLRTEIHC